MRHIYNKPYAYLIKDLNTNARIKDGGVEDTGKRKITGSELEAAMVRRIPSNTPDWEIGVSSRTYIDKEADKLSIQMRVDALIVQDGEPRAVTTLSQVPVEVLIEYADIKREVILYALGETVAVRSLMAFDHLQEAIESTGTEGADAGLAQEGYEDA
jgi:hypothetical protein